MSRAVALLRGAWVGADWLVLLPHLGALALTIAVCLARTTRVFGGSSGAPRQDVRGIEVGQDALGEPLRSCRRRRRSRLSASGLSSRSRVVPHTYGLLGGPIYSRFA